MAFLELKHVNMKLFLLVGWLGWGFSNSTQGLYP